MSQAIVDPSELRRFSQNLKHFSAELQVQMTRLHSQAQSLGQSWRDQEHLKFMAEFEQTLVALGRFVEASEQHVPFLQRKAERAEEYLRQR